MFNHYKCETTATISALFCKVLGGHTSVHQHELTKSFTHGSESVSVPLLLM